MTEPNTRDVLARAKRMAYLEAAARSITAARPRGDLRAIAAAALAALMALLPVAGAAQMLR